MSEKTDKDRYIAAAHRVQTGAAMRQGHPDQTPKHLRVGIDLGKAEAAGLVDLLIEKGIFTKDEYVKAIADAVEQEADMVEKEVQESMGHKVKLR